MVASGGGGFGMGYPGGGGTRRRLIADSPSVSPRIHAVAVLMEHQRSDRIGIVRAVGVVTIARPRKRHDWIVRSQLVLRSPQDGTGWSDSWAFSGRDESALRDCLTSLVAHLTPAPVERWDPQRHGRVVEAEDRWLAAMLLFADEEYKRRSYPTPPVQAEAAWTVAGARELAALLPDELEELRLAIEQRFGAVSD
jgi:hypothetical protein